MNTELIIRLLMLVGNILDRKGEKNVSPYVFLASSILESGDDIEKELKLLLIEMEDMVTEDRNPTRTEIDTVKDRRKSLSDRIKTHKDKMEV